MKQGTERSGWHIEATGPDGKDFFSQRQLLFLAVVVIICGAWAAFWGDWLALPAFVAAVAWCGWQAWRGRREGTRRW